MQIKPRTGPQAYQNWIASSSGNEARGRAEFPLYSDASFVDEISSGIGPYKVLNALGQPAGCFGYKITLVTEYHLRANLPDWEGLGPEASDPRLSSKKDRERIAGKRRARIEANKQFSGGTIEDEIAALLGLAMGVRLLAGAPTREYFEGDAMGLPRADMRPPVTLPARDGCRLQIPHATREVNVKNKCLPLISKYNSLDPAQASSLYKAARLYRDGLVLAESQPDLAWILFVSAVEVVAVDFQAQSPKDELLKSAAPKTCEMLQQANRSDILRELAEELAGRFKATARFLSFMQEFCPRRSPEPTLPAAFQLKWSDEKELKKQLDVIYSLRSNALHAGTPFPPAMNQPEPVVHDTGAYAERPVGHGSATFGGMWSASETPMLLHTFEYICRGSILSWWRSRYTTGPSSTPDPS